MTTNQNPITQTTSFTCESCGINVEDRMKNVSLSEAIERLESWNKPGSALCEDCWPEMSARQAEPGLYEKYQVVRTDGRPVGECFVLETDDPATAPAMLAYAAATDKETFAADLRERFGVTEPGADIPDEVVDAALAAIPWASVHQRADLRAALAAADAKRAELDGGKA